MDQAIRCVSTGAELGAEEAGALGLVNRLVAQFDGWLEQLSPPVVDRATMLAVRTAAAPDTRDGELAALVRSAAVPGLRQRIERYREQVLGSVVRASA